MTENRKPGRPKKEVEQEHELVVAQTTPDYTHLALGIYQDMKDKLWYTATLRFDPVTGAAMVTDRVLAGEDKYFANEAFRIKTVELEIL